jgi:uncharacterized SAM-binding protein YcdF (DUF218 family)
MFFALSKIFWLLAEPVSLLIILGVFGALLGFTRFARTGRAIMAGALLALAIISFTPLSAALIRPLEDRFPAASLQGPAPAGIIVLGGALLQNKSEARGQAILTGDANRLTSGVELARRYPTARLVFTGGSGKLIDVGAPEADGVRNFWLALGVAEERMSFETRSRNTWENALFTRDLLKPRPDETWLLVTSAWHMPRSVGIFRRLGFNVIPYPVAYRTFGDSRDFLSSANLGERLFMFEFAIREWIGLLAYRLTGKTDALFPAP